VYHTVTYNEELHIIETVSQGALSLAEAREIISEITQLSKAKDCYRCLSDYRQSTLAMSSFEIHDIPRIVADKVTELGLAPSMIKRAVVVAQDLEDFRFYETVSYNRNQSVKLFLNIDEARQWLVEK